MPATSELKILLDYPLQRRERRFVTRIERIAIGEAAEAPDHESDRPTVATERNCVSRPFQFSSQSDSLGGKLIQGHFCGLHHLHG